MTQPRISIVILNWNGLTDTIACIESLRNLDYPSFETVVVDNGSTGDDGVVLSARFGGFARVLKSPTNQGFAEGCNIGMREAFRAGPPDYVLLLNNDTVVAPDLLSAFVTACDSDPSVGIAGAKVYFHHAPDTIQSAGGRINWGNGLASLIGTNQPDRGQFDRIADVDWVSGCALLAKTAMIERVGMLYTPYFAYFEEVDWCARCRKAGYRVIVVPDAKVWHKKKLVVEDTAGAPMYYTTRNRFLFMKRNAGPLQFLSFILRSVLWHTASSTFISLLVRRRNARLLPSYYRGLLAGVRLMFRREPVVRPDSPSSR